MLRFCQHTRRAARTAYPWDAESWKREESEMSKKVVRRLIGIMAAAALMLMLSPELAGVAALPGAMVLGPGSTVDLPANRLVEAAVSDGGAAAIEDEGEGGVRLSAQGEGASSLTYRLLGVVPIRTVDISVEPERRLIPGGQSVGVAIKTDGVVVVGASDIGRITSPARKAGLRSGDVIRSVNGQAVSGAEALTELLKGGGAVELGFERDGESMSCQATPVLDERDGRWRLGAWVRDSTAGIGTLTFVDPDSLSYGALGHAITDTDTHVTLPVGEGELYENNVVDVTPGESGAPGELTGDFVFDAKMIGTVALNSRRGIFGTLEGVVDNALYPDGLPAARTGDIRPGPATLLTTVDGSGVRAFSCEIVRVNARNIDAQRAMVIRITDPELIERTGGIVQGMSGSPIIQGGKLVGAVTHVMINDPAMGYGIDIESMLNEADALAEDAEQAA